jgi:hypothetical protein
VDVAGVLLCVCLCVYNGHVMEILVLPKPGILLYLETIIPLFLLKTYYLKFILLFSIILLIIIILHFPSE